MSTAAEPLIQSVPRTPEEFEVLNRALEGSDPVRVLRWAADAFPEGKLALSTTFGVGGMALIHILHAEKIRLPVLFIDTLYHFPETLEHARATAERYDLNLRTLRAAPSREAFEAEHGAELWKRDEALFHRLTKVDPMREALAAEGYTGWITGRRRDQSPSRATMPIVEAAGVVKVNPLAEWSLDRIWEFVRENRIPYHPLHDFGYSSIGDEPLTTPTRPGEHERAGRWRGGGRLECGLHGI